jgi:hypothetical protein
MMSVRETRRTATAMLEPHQKDHCALTNGVAGWLPTRRMARIGSLPDQGASSASPPARWRTVA